MPCACKLDMEEYPDTAGWGPIFWAILHGLAEHAGVQTNLMMQMDELRSWFYILETVAKALPCEDCRSHYADWLKRNPVSPLKKMKYEDLRLWVRIWLLTLHNDVNQRLGKQLFAFQDLESTYKSVCIPTELARLEPIMKRAIRLNGVTLYGWKKWLLEIKKIIAIY